MLSLRNTLLLLALLFSESQAKGGSDKILSAAARKINPTSDNVATKKPYSSGFLKLKKSFTRPKKESSKNAPRPARPTAPLPAVQPKVNAKPTPLDASLRERLFTDDSSRAQSALRSAKGHTGWRPDVMDFLSLSRAQNPRLEDMLEEFLAYPGDIFGPPDQPGSKIGSGAGSVVASFLGADRTDLALRLMQDERVGLFPQYWARQTDNMVQILTDPGFQRYIKDGSLLYGAADEIEEPVENSIFLEVFSHPDVTASHLDRVITDWEVNTNAMNSELNLRNRYEPTVTDPVTGQKYPTRQLNLIRLVNLGKQGRWDEFTKGVRAINISNMSMETEQVKNMMWRVAWYCGAMNDQPEPMKLAMDYGDMRKHHSMFALFLCKHFNSYGALAAMLDHPVFWLKEAGIESKLDDELPYVKELMFRSSALQEAWKRRNGQCKLTDRNALEYFKDDMRLEYLSETVEETLDTLFQHYCGE